MFPRRPNTFKPKTSAHRPPHLQQTLMILSQLFNSGSFHRYAPFSDFPEVKWHTFEGWARKQSSGKGPLAPRLSLEQAVAVGVPFLTAWFSSCMLRSFEQERLLRLSTLRVQWVKQPHKLPNGRRLAS